jgi:hypothetical protein
MIQTTRKNRNILMAPSGVESKNALLGTVYPNKFTNACRLIKSANLNGGHAAGFYAIITR